MNHIALLSTLICVRKTASEEKFDALVDQLDVAILIAAGGVKELDQPSQCQHLT